MAAMRLPPFALERFFARYEFTAKHLLCSSDCESMSVADLLAMEPDARGQLDHLWLGYTDPLGDHALRTAISSLYTDISPTDLLVHSGAEEAIFNFMNETLAPGDHVVVHAPHYQSLGEVARAVGAEVTPWRGDPDQGWALDLDDLRQIVRPDTRLVVVNFPHNPTGFLPSESFLRALAELSEVHGFRVFSDEVYRGLEADDERRLPAFADLHPRAVSLGVMSKTYGLAGLRIGWVASRDADLLQRLAAFKDYTTICNSAPSELLATIALRNSDAVADRNRSIIRENLDRLDTFFASHADRFVWRRPLAGPIAFPRLLDGDVDTFCAELVEEAGILLLPGTLFGDGTNSFRIGFGRRSLPVALAALDRHLCR